MQTAMWHFGSQILPARLSEEQTQELIDQWERVWPPINEWGRLWNTRWDAGPSGRLRIKADGGYVVDVLVSRRSVFLQGENATGFVGKMQLYFLTGEAHVINIPDIEADEQLRESFRQFGADWTDIFRRDCWLAGFPVVATATEASEWMHHGRSLGMSEEELTSCLDANRRD